MVGFFGAAITNSLLLVADGPAIGIPLRFATGFFIAGVYPPALKLLPTWFRENRGLALGILAAAIVFGQGIPHSSLWFTLLTGLLWGITVVGDSAQFSKIVTETADQSYVATALTVQLAAGFAVTVVTIWLLPFLQEMFSWRRAFALLALGPIVGIMAMLRLRSSPESTKIGGGKG